jgi:hypothetical protein
MAAYSGTWNFFDSFKEYMGDGTIDLSDTTANRFMVLLLDVTTEPVAGTDTVLADVIANEITGTGYAQQDVASITWNEVTGTVTWDGADIAFAATGADWVGARWWVLYDDESVTITDALVAYGLVDDTPADVIVTNGTTLTLQWDALGLFTLA